uniref:NADH-ubiquinone oxidoreductase chain 2 n=1 Tax=Chelus fimbriata TaxID=44495 RepID=G0XMN2_CHEFI|nr:NADH dehydrogenase subunit 2 [Chelus fimbriata]ADN12050.1 NADH dehydrogenase subunit 2 [Chelus fimbriata]
MNPIAKGLMVVSLTMGPLLTMMSNHWILAWCGLEISTLSIIPLIAQQHHPRAIEAATKYFLIQAMASSMLLFSTIFNSWDLGQWNTTLLYNNTSCTLLTVALAMKLGLSPFHLCLPEVLQGTNTKTAMLLTTWQKLAPLTLLMMTHQHLNTPLLLLMGVLSAFLGGWGGLNQTQLRKMMAFSSIAHLGWMTIILTMSPKLTLLTFYLYSMMTISMFLMMEHLKTDKMSTIMTSWTKAPLMNSTMMMILMSLGGMPPLTGFSQKWLILQELIKQHLSPNCHANNYSFTTKPILLLTTLLLHCNHSTPKPIQPHPTVTTQNTKCKTTLSPSFLLINYTPTTSTNNTIYHLN